MNNTELNNKLSYNRYPYDKEGYVIHMVTSGERTFYSNAYIIETENAVVVVDTMMVVSDAIFLRQQIDNINKPLIAVIITHGHPDHYNGTEVVIQGFKDVPIISTKGVLNCIKDTVDSKEVKWKPYFGQDWPERKLLPTQLINDDDVLNLDGLKFHFRDLGAAESSSDLFFTVGESKSVVFVGDVVFNKMHGFMNDGHTKQWLQVLELLSIELASVETLFTGHGLPDKTLPLIQKQIDYILFYRTSLISLLSVNNDERLGDIQKEGFEKAMLARYPDYQLASFVKAGIEGVTNELTADK